MFEIVYKIYRKDLKMNLFMIVLGAIWLLLISAIISDVIDVNSYLNYIKTVPENYYYLSRHTVEDSEIYNNSLEEILKIPEVVGMGCFNNYTGITKNGEECEIYDLNDVMSSIRYQLSEGSRFSDAKKQEVVIGGKINSDYKIGDSIWIDTGDGRALEGIVVGKLLSPYAIKLKYASDEMNYQQMLSNTSSLCLTSRYEGKYQELYEKISWIIQGEEELKPEEFSIYGELESFDAIKKNTKELSNDIFSNSGVYLFLLGAMFLSTMLIISYITVCNQMDLIMIYRICGASFAKILWIIISIMIANFTASLLGFLLMVTIFLPKIQSVMGRWDNFMIHIIFIGISIFIFLSNGSGFSCFFSEKAHSYTGRNTV